MPFSREAALVRSTPALVSMERGNDPECMHPVVPRTHWDGAVIEECQSCLARVVYEVAQ